MKGMFIKKIKDPRWYSELDKLIGQNGLTYQNVKPFLKYLRLTDSEIANLLGISAAKYNRILLSQRIGKLVSKYFIGIDFIINRGVELFGTKELFLSWLQQPNEALAATPINLLTTPFGIDQIKDALGALEYGNVI